MGFEWNMLNIIHDYGILTSTIWRINQTLPRIYLKWKIRIQKVRNNKKNKQNLLVNKTTFGLGTNQVFFIELSIRDHRLLQLRMEKIKSGRQPNHGPKIME